MTQYKLDCHKNMKSSSTNFSVYNNFMVSCRSCGKVDKAATMYVYYDMSTTTYRTYLCTDCADKSKIKDGVHY